MKTTTGIPGVSIRYTLSGEPRYRAHPYIGNRCVYVGTYGTPEEAIAAIAKFRKEAKAKAAPVRRVDLADFIPSPVTDEELPPETSTIEVIVDTPRLLFVLPDQSTDRLVVFRELTEEQMREARRILRPGGNVVYRPQEDSPKIPRHVRYAK